jgi:hypothetical protein
MVGADRGDDQVLGEDARLTLPMRSDAAHRQ